MPHAFLLRSSPSRTTPSSSILSQRANFAITGTSSSAHLHGNAAASPATPLRRPSSASSQRTNIQSSPVHVYSNGTSSSVRKPFAAGQPAPMLFGSPPPIPKGSRISQSHSARRASRHEYLSRGRGSDQRDQQFEEGNGDEEQQKHNRLSSNFIDEEDAENVQFVYGPMVDVMREAQGRISRVAPQLNLHVLDPAHAEQAFATTPDVAFDLKNWEAYVHTVLQDSRKLDVDSLSQFKYHNPNVLREDQVYDVSDARHFMMAHQGLAASTRERFEELTREVAYLISEAGVSGKMVRLFRLLHEELDGLQLIKEHLSSEHSLLANVKDEISNQVARLQALKSSLEDELEKEKARFSDWTKELQDRLQSARKETLVWAEEVRKIDAIVRNAETMHAVLFKPTGMSNADKERGFHYANPVPIDSQTSLARDFAIRPQDAWIRWLDRQASTMREVVERLRSGAM
ncbi:putative mitochondrial protein [Andalucia godoyi]|uniref:Putative mitochondrial protein n=1 Tax=Andalucia godoyi TaxID=505711 RepID=A0A8K0AJ59_ANDGO|nr:putative mitochondrial protein [Andalucia godoyi]|eukprot:ANDGO_02092.mRNA.1 putative mitochondrial protein